MISMAYSGQLAIASRALSSSSRGTSSTMTVDCPYSVDVEELGRQPVAPGVALALVGIDPDLHGKTTGSTLGPRTCPPAQVIS